MERFWEFDNEQVNVDKDKHNEWHECSRIWVSGYAVGTGCTGGLRMDLGGAYGCMNVDQVN